MQIAIAAKGAFEFVLVLSASYHKPEHIQLRMQAGRVQVLNQTKFTILHCVLYHRYPLVWGVRRDSSSFCLQTKMKSLSRRTCYTRDLPSHSILPGFNVQPLPIHNTYPEKRKEVNSLARTSKKSATESLSSESHSMILTIDPVIGSIIVRSVDGQ
jgi:hypothetical protein